MVRGRVRLARGLGRGSHPRAAAGAEWDKGRGACLLRLWRRVDIGVAFRYALIVPAPRTYRHQVRGTMMNINPNTTPVPASAPAGISFFAGEKPEEDGHSLNVQGDQLTVAGDVEIANAVNDPFAFREYRWFRLSDTE